MMHRQFSRANASITGFFEQGQTRRIAAGKEDRAEGSLAPVARLAPDDSRFGTNHCMATNGRCRYVPPVLRDLGGPVSDLT